MKPAADNPTAQAHANRDRRGLFAPVWDGFWQTVGIASLMGVASLLASRGDTGILRHLNSIALTFGVLGAAIALFQFIRIVAALRTGHWWLERYAAEGRAAPAPASVRPVPVGAQATVVSDGVRLAQDAVRIVPLPGGGWRVVQADSDDAISEHASDDGARRAAVEYARVHGEHSVAVYGDDGELHELFRV